MADSPEPPPRRTTEEEYAAIFESDAFDGVTMTPAEYKDYRAKRRAERTGD